MVSGPGARVGQEREELAAKLRDKSPGHSLALSLEAEVGTQA